MGDSECVWEVRRLLESGVKSACYMVYGMAELDPEKKGMSTTLSALLVRANYAFAVHVGDSRVYRVRNKSSILQLTEDHTLINYKVKHGMMTKEEAEKATGKNVITESNSTAITALKEKQPSIQPILFTENAQCVAALKQGRGDAYVLDQSILLSTALKDPSVKVVGEPFSADNYGIGCSKDTPDAKAFINAWLKTIEDGGQWQQLWQQTVGTVLKSTNTKPPAIAA